MPARILVIEDNPANLDLMAYLLTAFGHITLTAQDGEEGLEVARQEVPELIICDVQLPRMDGYEVARQLKSNPRLQTIPLVAVTALAMVGDRDKLLAAGFDGYIAKPLAPETFVPEIEQFLAGKQGRATPLASTLPLVEPATPSNKLATLLVVDNLPVNLELARSLFEPLGYTVLTALGKAAALALARQQQPDLILSDVHMGADTGYDFLTTLKADPQLSTIPFVFLTSTAMSTLEQAQGLRLGAVRYLLRPIEPPALLAVVAACLQESRRD
jgi:two-component system cell cycle response regulator